MQSMSTLSRESARRTPDTILVERARARDTAAFTELIVRHEDKLSRLSTRFVRTAMDGQDVLQAALLSAWQHLPNFEGRAGFGSWMYRVTTNAALMHLRKKKRSPEVAVDEFEPLASKEVAHTNGFMLGGQSGWCQRPDECIAGQELRDRLQSAVDALPEMQRSVFLLRHIDDLSTEDTADALGLTAAAVKTRLHRARAVLRRVMKDYAEY